MSLEEILAYRDEVQRTHRQVAVLHREMLNMCAKATASRGAARQLRAQIQNLRAAGTQRSCTAYWFDLSAGCGILLPNHPLPVWRDRQEDKQGGNTRILRKSGNEHPTD